MARKTKIAADQPICIRVGGVTIVVRRLEARVAQVVVVNAPKDAEISVSNRDAPPA